MSEVMKIVSETTSNQMYLRIPTFRASRTAFKNSTVYMLFSETLEIAFMATNSRNSVRFISSSVTKHLSMYRNISDRVDRFL